MNIIISYYDFNKNLIYNYKIYIYNSHNKLVLKNKTKSGYINFTPNYYDLYKIVFISNNPHIPNNFYTYFYFNNKKDKILPIHLNNFNKKAFPLIKILLKDLYYEDMIIERGKIILWQKSMK